METKHLLALIILVGCGSGLFFLSLLSQRARDIGLFVFVFGAVYLEKLNVTFLGQFWYRGTSRGIEISLLDLIPFCLLAANFIVPRYARGRFFWPASLGLMFVYLAYCLGSVLCSTPQIYGVWEYAKLVRGVVVFLAAALFIRTRRELAVVVVALGCAACLEAFNGLEQRFAKGVFRTPGTLGHENTLSTYLCMITPVLVAAAMSNWNKWLRWFAGFSALMAAGAELMTLSRMGVPVFFLVVIGTTLACTSWTLTLRKVTIAVTALALLGGFVFFSWDGLKARYTQSDITSEFTDEHAVETRGVYWRLAFLMMDDHPYGVGLNNWSYYVGKSYGRDLGYPYTDYDDFKWIPSKDEAHETFLPPAADTLPALMLGELGIAGLVVFLLVWFRWFQCGIVFLGDRLNDDPMHRMALGFLFGAVGIFMQSATEWTYKQTPVMFTCHVMMGALASLYYARRRARKEAKLMQREEETDVIIDALPVHAARVGK